MPDTTIYQLALTVLHLNHTKPDEKASILNSEMASENPIGFRDVT